jgi:hypothetical protein
MIAFVELGNGVLYWMLVGCVYQKVYLLLPNVRVCCCQNSEIETHNRSPKGIAQYRYIGESILQLE